MYKDLRQKLIVPPGEKISLKGDYDPRYKPDDFNKEDLELKLQEGIQELASYQDKLWAEHQHSVLIILQALDAAGKDGTIKHVMSGLNPQGCDVSSFKAPSERELAHDYLWRAHSKMPSSGKIGIFNRSYYEEVIVVRVHPELLDKQHLPEETKGKNIWKQRFTEINNFEKYLVDNGITVLKFYLNLSKEEQKRRFLERIEEPEKNWKFSSNDAAEREHWNEYIKAYEDCFNHTSTEWAPWYIIPADYKPFARLAVAEIITAELKELDPTYPVISKKERHKLLEVKATLTGKS